jgi:hypothetical protein
MRNGLECCIGACQELVVGKRRCGRTRVRWLDDVVERDAASTGVGKDLEEAAAD